MNVEQITAPTTKEFPTTSSVTVMVVSGRVEVVAAPHTQVVTARVDAISGPPLTASADGAVLRLEQTKDADGQVWGAVASFLRSFTTPEDRPSVDLTLTVPDTVAVTVRSVSAGVTVTGSHGNVTVQTVAGTVALDHTTGVVDVATVSGAVDCTGISGEIKAKTVSGRIDVTDAVLRSARLNSVSGRTDLTLRHGPSLVTTNTVSGATTIRIPTPSGYDATTASTSGHVVVDGEPLLSDGKRGGHRYTGDRSVVVKARTVSGDLVVTRDTAAPRTDTTPGPVIGDPHTPDVQDEIRRDGL